MNGKTIGKRVRKGAENMGTQLTRRKQGLAQFCGFRAFAPGKPRPTRPMTYGFIGKLGFDDPPGPKRKELDPAATGSSAGLNAGAHWQVGNTDAMAVTQ